MYWDAKLQHKSAAGALQEAGPRDALEFVNVHRYFMK